MNYSYASPLRAVWQIVDSEVVVCNVVEVDSDIIARNNFRGLIREVWQLCALDVATSLSSFIKSSRVKTCAFDPLPASVITKCLPWLLPVN